ncbi:MAG: polysaccharide biosynthesis protein [Flavipsychrobacter sp.]|nr:polysaccharide biosynthesis protein [Flavipsychrobacter sp.]
MSNIKKLAGQTMWYGVSSILARFLNYLLTPYLTRQLSTAAYGEMGLIYAAIPFVTNVFSYGMETTFFRYTNKEDDDRNVYNTTALSLITTTLLFTALLLLFQQQIANFLRVENHPEFIRWSAYIIALDTLALMPFSRLRNNNRPRKYASIKVANILVNIGMTVFFYSVLPDMAKNSPDSFIASWYHPELGVGYVILANLIASSVTLLLLIPEASAIQFKFDKKLWREMIIYSLPIMIASFGGIINETFDRIMLSWWSPAATEIAKKEEVGIYNACYKLSILITLFVQAFRMGAEPFFFKQAKGEDAQRIYARVMDYFVITICTMFLVVTLYIDIWKHFIQNERMWTGLKIVPVLLVANMCLGVYYNLSIWYKLSQKTNAGATITFIGAAITLVINYLFIPYFGYMACAVATLACYGSMMLISYFWGQKVYPVPYKVGKIGTFFLLMLLCYFVYFVFSNYVEVVWMRYVVATILLAVYVLFVLKKEGKELQKLPVVGKYFR